MRLWSLHPCYLDSKGLVALWREALLAQAVLRGETIGYKNHPQLARFRSTEQPVDAIARYLDGVLAEAGSRAFNFDAAKIRGSPGVATVMAVSQGQLSFEADHLAAKLQIRDPSRLDRLREVPVPRAHPLFRVEPGPIADFERGSN